MALFASNIITSDSALGSAVIQRSLRIDQGTSDTDSGSNYSRTFDASGNRRTFTKSVWVKKCGTPGNIGDDQYSIISAGGGGSGSSALNLYFYNNDRIQYGGGIGGSSSFQLYTTRLFRDHTAWYHIVAAVDTTESTSSDRVKLYVNGVQETDFETSTYPTQNYELYFNFNVIHRIGSNSLWSDLSRSYGNFNGYLAEFNFIDGTALTPSSFGFTDGQTGIWMPKRFEKSSIPNKKGTTFSGSGWTVSGGSGFSGSKPITNAYNGSIGTSNSDVANNSAGGAFLTWDTSAYNLTGNLRIFCWSDGGEYDIYVNGNSGSTTKVGDTPSGSGNAAWIDCGTFDHIKEIQLSGTTYNTDTGLGSSGVYIAGFMVNGTHLRDDIPEYGTNGFHLEFKDNSSTSALGKDTSGNGNDFTANNFSVTAGKDDDSMIDTPTNNFPTFNLSNRSTQPTISNGNLRMRYNYKPATKTTRATFRLPKSGKYYWEWQNEESSSNPGRWQSTIGNVEELAENSVDVNAANNANFVSYSYGGSTWNGTTHVSVSWDGTTRSWYSPERAAWAVDCDTGNVWVGRVASDGTTQWWAPDGSATGNPSKLLNPTCGIDKDKTHEYAPMVCWHDGGGASSTAFAINVNFGQHSFLGTIPDGFKTLSSTNIQPDPTINKIVRPKRHFDVLTWTGNGSTGQNITGLEFKPDLLWIKKRNETESWGGYDSVRGVNKRLYINDSNAEETITTLSAFYHGGFRVEGSGGGPTNDNGDTYVGFCWKAGGAAVSNSDGTITSSVSVNDEAGFSIVSYSGDGNSTATIGHGLSKAPKWIITKCRSTSTHADWVVWHEELSDNKNVYLNQSNAEATPSYGHITDPTSTLINVTKGSGNQTNASGETYISYCWSEVPGFSKFGSYIGNGSSDGTFIHLGFKPAYFVFKGLTSNSWYVYDNKRDPINPVDIELNFNNNQSEASSHDIDFLSNGVKMRTNNSSWNYNNYTYIYMAFAEQPGTTSFNTITNAR